MVGQYKVFGVLNGATQMEPLQHALEGMIAEDDIVVGNVYVGHVGLDRRQVGQQAGKLSRRTHVFATVDGQLRLAVSRMQKGRIRVRQPGSEIPLGHEENKAEIACRFLGQNRIKDTVQKTRSQSLWN